MSTKYTGAVLTPNEVQVVVEAIELVLGDYEDQYWVAEGHDSPEEWIIARTQFRDWVDLYVRLTGRSWLGHKHVWDAMGPHEKVTTVVPGTPEWDASEVVLIEQRLKGG